MVAVSFSPFYYPPLDRSRGAIGDGRRGFQATVRNANGSYVAERRLKTLRHVQASLRDGGGLRRVSWAEAHDYHQHIAPRLVGKR